ncbi:MAG: c-type cytochrome [Acidiferrobacterales bacterium]
MKKAWIVIAAAILSVAACKREITQPASRAAGQDSVSSQSGSFSSGQIALGGRLFQADCAPCHGAQAQGHPGWQAPGGGLFTAAAPPLNGTGNVWKRSRAQLIATIVQGARLPDGTRVMPAWKQRLSPSEIRYIVAWFQSLWPPSIYRRRARMQGGRSPRG